MTNTNRLFTRARKRVLSLAPLLIAACNGIEGDDLAAHPDEAPAVSAGAQGLTVYPPGRGAQTISNGRVVASIDPATGRLTVGQVGKQPFVLERTAVDRRVLCVARERQPESCVDDWPQAWASVSVSRQDGPSPCVTSVYSNPRFGFNFPWPGVPRPSLMVAWQVCAIAGTDEVRVRLSALGETSGQYIERLAFPFPPTLSPRQHGYAVAPINNGTMFPTGWITAEPTWSMGTAFHWEADAQGRAFTLPFFGVVEGDGRALLVEVRTEADAFLQVHQEPGDAARINAGFRSSLDRFAAGGTRELVLVPFEAASYNDFAARYRDRALATGRHVSLAEKRALRPQVGNLIGGAQISALAEFNRVQRPSIPAEQHVQYTFADMQRLLAAAAQQPQSPIRRGILQVDGWGQRGYDNLHPDVIVPPGQCMPRPGGARDCGASALAGGYAGLEALTEAVQEMPGASFSLELHDNYRDFYEDAQSFGQGELALVDRLGGQPRFDLWDGGPSRLLCASRALPFLERNYDELARRGIEPEFSYLDVFTAVGAEECHAGQHRMRRAESLAHRRGLFGALADRGISSSSEEPADFAVRDIDHAFWAWHQGHMRRSPGLDPGSARALGALGFNTPLGVPIPLFELVYHDALIIPWAILTGDFGENMMRGWVTAGIPAVNIGDLAYPAPRAEMRTLMRLNRALATRAMRSHRYLDDRFMEQQVEFDDGSRTSADADASTIASAGVVAIPERRIGGLYRVVPTVTASRIHGACLELSLRWRTEHDLRGLPPHRVFLHVVDRQTPWLPRANADHDPPTPTTQWNAGTVTNDPAITLCGSPTRPPQAGEEYAVIAGLYDGTAPSRLPIVTERDDLSFLVGTLAVDAGGRWAFRPRPVVGEARLVLARVSGDRTVEIMTEWYVGADVPPGNMIFIHVVDAAGSIVINGDYRPQRAPDSWVYLARRREQRRVLTFSADRIPGTYTVVTGMYNPTTGARVPFESADASASFRLARLTLTAGPNGAIGRLQACPAGMPSCP